MCPSCPCLSNPLVRRTLLPSGHASVLLRAWARVHARSAALSCHQFLAGMDLPKSSLRNKWRKVCDRLLSNAADPPSCSQIQSNIRMFSAPRCRRGTASHLNPSPSTSCANMQVAIEPQDRRPIPLYSMCEPNHQRFSSSCLGHARQLIEKREKNHKPCDLPESAIYWPWCFRTSDLFAEPMAKR